MGIRALMVSPDAASLAVLVGEWQKLEVEPIACSAQLDALDLLWQERYDAVLVDCDALPGGMDLVKLVRLACGRTAVVLALVTGEAGMKQAFDHGANLALEKPVTPQNAARTLRAARSLMITDQRRYFRLPAEFDVQLHSEQGGQLLDLTVKSTDVSVGGMALKVQHPLPPRLLLEVSFKPAGMEKRVHAEAEVAWSDARGECGLRFLHLPLNERRVFENWLNAELRKRAGGVEEATAPPAKTT